MEVDSDKSAPARVADRSLLGRALDAAGHAVIVTGADIEHPGPIICFANKAALELTGYSPEELVGRSPRILQGPDTDRTSLDALKHALRRGESFTGEAVNYRKNGQPYTVEWMMSPIRNDAGAIDGWIAMQRDVTCRRRHRQARQEVEERLRVLVAELQHRTRNLMGVMRSMAVKTARTSRDLTDFQARFGMRLDALARAQALLSRLGEQDRVTFDELVRTELSALHGSLDRVDIRGPAGVRLRSSTVQTLAMAIHELATNSVKYGALGQPQARLAVQWSLGPARADGTPWLNIVWEESGVAMPARDALPQGGGQGRELIERALPYQLSAESRYVFGADGVCCAISIPVSATNVVDG